MRFSLNAILASTTGTNFGSLDEMFLMYSFMTNTPEGVTSIQAMDISDTINRYLLDQFPFLQGVVEPSWPDGTSRKDILAIVGSFMAEQERLYGHFLDVQPVPLDDRALRKTEDIALEHNPDLQFIDPEDF